MSRRSASQVCAAGTGEVELGDADLHDRARARLPAERNRKMLGAAADSETGLSLPQVLGPVGLRYDGFHLVSDSRHSL